MWDCIPVICYCFVCEDGLPVGVPTLTPHKHCSSGCQKRAGLGSIYTRWKCFHTGESSQLEGEWDNAHPPSSVHTEEVVELVLLSKMGTIAGDSLS